MKQLFVSSLLIVVLCATNSTAQKSDDDSLQTIAERSNYQSTARYGEVIEFCKQLSQRSDRIRRTSFGKSFEGRELPLLVISDPPVQTPEELRRSGKLPIFVMANIHAGEVCGKEASLMLARELMGSLGDQLLDRVAVLIAPIYNADGNERFSKQHRTNQVGPANGMGQRHNLQDLDLNRDHIKLESPEARALAQLISEWDPAILIDTHTTNGSYHQYTITFDGPRSPASSDRLIEFTRDTLLPGVSDSMLERSGYRSFYYGNFDEPHQQWETYPELPRYSVHYFGMRGKIGVLSEAYSYASYKDRVLATKSFVESCLTWAHKNRSSVQKVLDAAHDARPPQIAIRSERVPLPNRYDILGFVEQRDENGKWRPTDEKRTYAGVRFLGLSRATDTVARPKHYVVPARMANVIDNLKAHGIALRSIEQPERRKVERYRIDHIQRADNEFQQHRTVELHVSAETAEVELHVGDQLVATDQPLGTLAAVLLEPASQDGLATWNFFDAELKAGEPYPVFRLP